MKVAEGVRDEGNREGDGMGCVEAIAKLEKIGSGFTKNLGCSKPPNLYQIPVNILELLIGFLFLFGNLI